MMPASSFDAPPGSSAAAAPAGALSLTFRNLVVATSPQPSYAQRAGKAVEHAWRAMRARAAGGPAGGAAAAAAGELQSAAQQPPPRVKYILNRASGYIPPNALTAVMGGSGAGKTTLCNFLAHRLAGCGAAHRSDDADEEERRRRAKEEQDEAAAAALGGYRVSGEIRVNGQEVSSKFFAKVCAYVPQQSILLSSLTPRESINFASKLRLPDDTTEEEHAENTERVIAALALNACANTRVGDELTGGGLSGGEKRRTNVAVELVTSPPLLCLDEPTTGLDSLTALNVVKSLKQLTRCAPRSVSKRSPEPSRVGAGGEVASESPRGVTVICSIHQPSSEMFSLFDHLILLSSGLVVYCGPAHSAIAYFAALGHPCPPLENPPEFFLDLILCGGPELLAQLAEKYREEFEEKYAEMQHRAAIEEAQARIDHSNNSSSHQHSHHHLTSPRADASSPAMLREEDTPEPPTSSSALVQRRGSLGAAVAAATANDAPATSTAISPLHKGSSRLDLSPDELHKVSAKLRLWQKVRDALSPRRRQMQQEDHGAEAQPLKEYASGRGGTGGGQEGEDERKLARIDEHPNGHSRSSSSFQLPGDLAEEPPTLRAKLRHSWYQLYYLTHRAHLNASRLPLLKGAQILQTVVLGLLVGLVFMNLGTDQLAVQNRLGAVYFIVICVIFANTLSVVLTFSEERSVLIREQGNRMYAVWVYFLARTSIEIVPTFLCSFGLALICFWMIDPSASGSQFGKFMFLLVLLAYAGQGIGLIVSCGIASRMLAMIVTPLAIAPFILFTPYSTRLDSIPGYFRPFQVGSPFWWGFTGLMLNMFHGLQFHCSLSQTVSIPLSDGSFYLLCPYETGLGVLERFHIEVTTATGEDHFWVCCGVLFILSFIYRIIALLGLYKLAWDVKDATK